jgi:hypothetical protein
MNKKFAQFALPVLAFAFASAVQANTSQIVDFGVGGSTFFNTKGSEVAYIDASLPLASGFLPMNTYGGYKSLAELTGSQWMATAFREASPAVFTASSSSSPLFDLNSLSLAGVWGSQTLTLVGYINGVETHSFDFKISTVAQEYTFTGFTGIDSFAIITNPYLDYAVEVRPPNGGSGGTSWVLSSVEVTVVPEPQTYAMLLAGLGIVGAIARRRQRS